MYRDVLEEVIVPKFVLLILMLFSHISQAKDSEVLSVDRSIPSNFEFSFPNDRDIKPNAGDFEIANFFLMSNESGERWAVITLTNLSSGQRELNQGHLIGLFADGSRNNPLEFKLNFKGNETQTISVTFGKYKFPILKVMSSS